MKKKRLSLTALLLLPTFIFALSNAPVETKAGKLIIKKTPDDIKIAARILLNGKMIKAFPERPYVYFEKNFKGKKSDIVFVKCNYGGSHTANDFMVIELFKNGKHKVSPIVGSCNGEYKVTKSTEGVLKVDFGRCGGKHKRATYRNGSFK